MRESGGCDGVGQSVVGRGMGGGGGLRAMAPTPNEYGPLVIGMGGANGRNTIRRQRLE